MKLSSDKKLAENQTDRVGAIKELIKNESVMTLLLFDIQEDTLHVVDQDAEELMQKEKRYYDERSEFRKCYESIKRHNNIIQTTAFSKVWSYKFHYDEDSSLISMYIYYNTVLGKDDSCKLSSTTDYKYLISCKDITFCGDTMNSWTTTLNEFGSLYCNEYLKGECIKKYKGKDISGNGSTWIECFSDIDNYQENKYLPSYTKDFLKVVYTIGNFIPVPDGFNVSRFKTTKDYWDLTLLLIYKWYHSSSQEYEGNLKDFYLQRLVCEQKEIDSCKKWLNMFRDWNNFVERNYMQPFVKQIKCKEGKQQYGEPLELWDGHFNGGMLPIKDKDYRKRNKENDDWQFKQFFVNARERILQRGWLIANALIENE